MSEALVFYSISFLILFSGTLVVFCKKPVHSAIFLILCFVSVAGMYLYLDAEFIAAVQILVYAGGIMVLFLFMIMLVSMRELLKLKRFHKQAVAGVFFVVFVLALAGHYIAHFDFGDKASAQKVSENIMGQQVNGEPILNAGGKEIHGNVEALANELFYNYLFPFELASIYLLAAMVGAIVLVKREDN